MLRAVGLFFFGFAMHSVAPFIDALPKGWGNLTRSAIGVLMGWPAVVAFATEYKDVPNPNTRATLRYFSGFIPLGVGVVAAYMFSHFFSQERNDGR